MRSEDKHDHNIEISAKITNREKYMKGIFQNMLKLEW